MDILWPRWVARIGVAWVGRSSVVVERNFTQQPVLYREWSPPCTALRACRVPCQEQESPTCAPDRPSKILLVQVGTLSSSPIPRLGLSVFFLSFFREDSLGALGSCRVPDHPSMSYVCPCTVALCTTPGSLSLSPHLIVRPIPKLDFLLSTLSNSLKREK